jgi:TPR repeat protein
LNRIFKAAIATLVSALVIGLAIAYVPDLRVKTMLTFRRAANIVGLVDWDPVEEGRAAAQRGDFATALELWRPLAERGHAAAQNHLGLAYELGDGVPQDDAIAVAWYQKAADQGNARAQTNLGEMYEKGKGVPQDNAIALSSYRKAADEGSAYARNIIGDMYREGTGVPQDY